MRMRQRVLIVDDNSDIRRLYAIGLNQRGFEVKLAANGAEALERIVDEKPDVVLLDWLMPLMDGGELLDRIGNDNGHSIPVIVISGQGTVARAVEAGQAGAFDFLEKLISGQPAPQPLDPRIQAWLCKPVTVDELCHVLSPES